MIASLLAHLAALLVMPFVMVGVINRTKSLWSGRKGPRILQLAFDVRRLLRKSSVYSTTTTPLFRIAPWVLLVTAIGSVSVAPLLGTQPLVSFPFDFVWFAYVWGLGRVALMLAALDTGSAFEGMGACREAVFAALLEPVLFVVLGALCCFANTATMYDGLLLSWHGGAATVVGIGAVLALLVVLQTESARMPVDDPTTHLELTMVHEVMVLDHSGKDLAAIQLAAALKLYVGASFVATLLNPWAGGNGLTPMIANLGLSVMVAVVVGGVESLTARLKMRAVPHYIGLALLVSAIALLATAWRTAGRR